ncbi:MAG: ArnT family glycosyltransferase, partial [Salibacteraceae bacterium]
MRQLVPAFAFFLVLWAFFGTNNVLELRAEEPRRAIVALEMVLQDQWTVPTIHGEPYYNKPPVFNWVLASFYRLTGSTNEWVTRLPGLLSLLLLAGAHYLFTRKYLGETIARWSAVFLLCTGDLLFYGAVNSGEIDLFYALVSYLQVACIFHFFHRRQWWLLYLGSYALMTVGLLTKGLSSLPLQGFTLLALLLYHRQWKALFAPAHFVGLGLSFGLLLLYFQQYANLNDPWPYLTNLVNEASHKTGAETPLLETVQHLVSFPLQVLQVLLPWSLLLVLFFRKGTGKTLWQNDWLRYSVLFLAANLWLYWLSPGTKNRYLYLFFPFLLSLFTWMWLTFRERAPQLVKWANHGLTVALGIGVLVLLALPWAGGDELIRQHTALLWCLPVFGVLALVLHLQWKDWRPASLVIFLFLFR